MELPRRTPDDVYLPDGSLLDALQRLKKRTDAHDLNIGIVYPFDYRTRMLPYWYADRRMAPACVRVLADCLNVAGFKNIRIVLQQWTPNFKPSLARLNGKPLDMLLVSAMQIHAEPAYDIIRDAHAMGAERPLILAGGPKATYEPTDYFELGPRPGIGVDCVSTGEVYVFLELLERILDNCRPGEKPLAGYERARQEGGLKDIAGLVYLDPSLEYAAASTTGRVAINTGVQRLLRNLDEIPLADAGYRVIEPPHRRSTLSAQPHPAKKVGKLSIVASIISTQGCKFACSYCPIPALNQRTWRHKSPARLAAEMRHIYENFGIKEFFSTDDNFFNTRSTVIELMTELARTKTRGRPLGEIIRFYTEATEYDVYKNMDILPICKAGGMAAIWFGIEDITAELVNKGQTPGKTTEVYDRLRSLGIEPMAMMIHNDHQPLRSAPGTLDGVVNQAEYMFEKGAVSYQCTYLGPAVGTIDFEPAAKGRVIFKTVGGEQIPQAFQDGNHVAASRHPRPWERQINVLRAYAAFYNPMNCLRIIANWRNDGLSARRLLFQVIGQIGIVLSAPKMFSWARKLKKGPIEKWEGLQFARIPMIDVNTGVEVNWGIEFLPNPELPQNIEHKKAVRQTSLFGDLVPETEQVLEPAMA
jgi:radical SAM superfamily enzyme YgiQ (UPF0313 family)